MNGLQRTGGGRRDTIMADWREQLRLFDPAGDAAAPSSVETEWASSHPRTPRRTSPIETASVVSPDEMQPAAHHPSPASRDSAGALDELAVAAADVVTARRALDTAIAVARSTGASWRTIGAVTGLPF